MSDPKHTAARPNTSTVVQPGQATALQAQTAAEVPANGTSLSTTPPDNSLGPLPSDPQPLDTKTRATVAARARWDKVAAERFDWEGAPLEEAHHHLANLRREIELGGRILQQRSSTSTDANVPCAVCNKPMQNGRWMQQRTVRDPETGLLRAVFLCSVVCINAYSTNPGNYAPKSELGPTGLPKPDLPLAVQAELDKQAAAKQPKEARERGVEGMLT